MARNMKRRFDVLEASIKPGAKLVKKSLCQCGFIVSLLKTLGLVLLYYTFSITLTFYNQRFIHRFRFPLSITLVHLVTKFCIAVMIRWCLSCRSTEDRINLSWGDYIKRIGPPGVFSSIDIGLSNWSFEFITVSLYTMTKSTVIIFILGFSFLFRLEKPRCSLIVVVLFVAAGLFMFTYQSTQFNLTGFLLVLSASFLSGLRWTTTQLVLQRKTLGLTNPLDMIYHIQPWMILTLLPLSAAFEGLHVATSSEVFGYTDTVHLLRNIGLLMMGAGVAFMMEYSEFLLLTFTSSLTLSIAGIFKEICTLYLAVEFNGDKMSSLNAVGLLVCLMGIAMHVTLKAMAKEKGQKGREQIDDSVKMLLENGDSDEDEELFNVQRDR